MRTVTLDEALAVIAESENYCAIIEDWDNGLLFHASVPGNELLAYLSELREKYGPGFRFRFFNEMLDLRWNAGCGLLAEGSVSEEQLVETLLESDTGRHPGLRAFGSPRGIRILTHVIHSNGQPVFTRFVKILPGGE